MLPPQGLYDIGKVKAGETLVVSGAAGAVGSVVCQMGKLAGAKVIAIAGSEDKCKWLKEDIGVDAVLNYKSPTFKEEFKEVVGYFDVYFDNVGGEILNFALTRMKQFARIALCGGCLTFFVSVLLFFSLKLLTIFRPPWLIGAISDYSK